MSAVFALPLLLLNLLVGSGAERSGDVTMFDFREDSTSDWIIVNDGVMGGLSQSEFTRSGEGYATFQGTMSLENNGGFASVRALVPSELPSATRTVTLSVRGDGRTFQLRFRTDRRLDGIAYMAEFSTVVGEWLTIEIPISEFRPTFRGWTPPDAPSLDPGEIRQVGLMVADKKAGPFRLDVERITASD